MELHIKLSGNKNDIQDFIGTMAIIHAEGAMALSEKFETEDALLDALIRRYNKSKGLLN